MSAPVDVRVVLRQMQANSSHFRNGLPALADHHEGEFERELSAIAAVDELIEASKMSRRALAWAAEQRPEFASEYEAMDAAIARVGGAK